MLGYKGGVGGSKKNTTAKTRARRPPKRKVRGLRWRCGPISQVSALAYRAVVEIYEVTILRPFRNVAVVLSKVIALRIEPLQHYRKSLH
jgi:hypothetical protein